MAAARASRSPRWRPPRAYALPRPRLVPGGPPHPAGPGERGRQSLDRSPGDDVALLDPAEVAGAGRGNHMTPAGNGLRGDPRLGLGGRGEGLRRVEAEIRQTKAEALGRVGERL